MPFKCAVFFDNCCGICRQMPYVHEAFRTSYLLQKLGLRGLANAYVNIDIDMQAYVYIYIYDIIMYRSRFLYRCQCLNIIYIYMYINISYIYTHIIEVHIYNVVHSFIAHIVGTKLLVHLQLLRADHARLRGPRRFQ